MFKNINQLTIEDLFNPEYFSKEGQYGYNGITDCEIHNQEVFGLHRLFRLVPLFIDGVIKLDYNHIHKFMKFRLVDDNDYQVILRALFDTFSMNHNFILSTSLEVSTSKKWIDESYEDCRLRNLWEVMDQLGLNKRGGYGNFIGQTKTLKYYRPKGIINEDGTLPLDLD